MNKENLLRRFHNSVGYNEASTSERGVMDKAADIILTYALQEFETEKRLKDDHVDYLRNQAATMEEELKTVARIFKKYAED